MAYSITAVHGIKSERREEENQKESGQREGGEASEKHAHVRVSTKSPGRPSQVANPGSHMYGPKHAEADEGGEREERGERQEEERKGQRSSPERLSQLADACGSLHAQPKARQPAR